MGTTTVDATHPYGTPQSPYTMTSFRGTVVNFGGQVDGQPEVSAIRGDGTGGYNAKPIAGAYIVAFMNPAPLVADGSGNLDLPAGVNLTGCSTTFGSTTVNCTSTSGLSQGMAIVGLGVGNGALPAQHRAWIRFLREDVVRGDLGVRPPQFHLQHEAGVSAIHVPYKGLGPQVTDTIAGVVDFFVSTWQFLNALTVYKFHVDWARISLSTFTGPDTPLAATSWPNAAVASVPAQGGNNLDPVALRAMAQNQYSNIGGVESLWTTHTRSSPRPRSKSRRRKAPPKNRGR